MLVVTLDCRIEVSEVKRLHNSQTRDLLERLRKAA